MSQETYDAGSGPVNPVACPWCLSRGVECHHSRLPSRTLAPDALLEQIKKLQQYAEALRIVDFNERKQEFFCRACRYRDPLGPDGNKLHADDCPWVDYVRQFKKVLDGADALVSSMRCVCSVEDSLVQEWVSKAREVARSKGFNPA